MKRLQHVSRRKYIQNMLKYYSGGKLPFPFPGRARRRIKRILGYAYDDTVSGKLTLY